MNEHFKKLIAMRKEKAERMRAILDAAKEDGNRALTADEATEYDALDAELDTIAADIKRTEKQIETERNLQEPQRKPLAGGSRGKEPKQNPSDVDVDVKRYSLMRAINAAVTGNWDEAQYERELSIKIADNLGRDAAGFFVPYEVQRTVMATQAGTNFTDAGALVGTEHMDNMFIESLQADSFVVGAGAQVLTGLVGDVDIPRALGGVSFTWVDEDGTPAESNGTYDSVRMSPKTIAGAVPITRRLLKQSSPSVEMLIMQDIKTGVALAIDEVVIAGDGASGKPKGIMNTTGVNTVTLADTTNGVPTFAEAVAFETALAEDNALRGAPIYATTPTIAGATKTTPIDSGSGIMLNVDNKINGYRVVPTTLVPATKTIFGNFNDIIIGMWGVMDIVVDTAAKAADGGIVLRVFQDIDVAVRHPQSFSITA